jgi:hypothetical protein
MSIICWTVFYPGAPSVSHSVTRLAHAAGRRVRPIVHHATRVQHHMANVAPPSHGWFKLVCKLIPAGLAGGGALLAPPSATPTHLPMTPPAIVAPGPLVSLGSPQTRHFWPMTPPTPATPDVPATPQFGDFPPTYFAGEPPTAVPEPSSAAILLGGIAGLRLLRLGKQRLAYSSGHIEATVGQT